MTYSLHTLYRDAPSPDEEAAPVSVWLRFAQELALLVGIVLLTLGALALWSYRASDPAWSTSGSTPTVRNWLGVPGAWGADIVFFAFGFSAWWIWLASFSRWWRAYRRWLAGPDADLPPAPSTWRFWGGLLLLCMASASLEWTRLHRFDAYLPGQSGGVFGQLLGLLSVRHIGYNGAALLSLALLLQGLSAAFGFGWTQVAERIGQRIDASIRRRQIEREQATDRALGEQALREREQALQPATAPMPHERHEPTWDHELSAPAPRPDGELPLPEVPLAPSAPPPMVIEPGPTEVPRSERVVKERQKPLFNELPDSRLPQVDLLDALSGRQETVSPETLEMTSRLIEKKLKDFGVEVRVVAAAPGPVITRYEIEPATGVKGSQIVNLAKDLARSLSLVSIRVIETIPGKNYMALELPNAKRQSIKLSEILGSQVYNEARSMLTIGLGKDIIGNPVVADLAKMPHVLVAGTTGSGKSVGINAMILSLLYKAEAHDVRLLMIDPKMLEMSVYEGIPHLLAPVVTDMKQAANGLNWCVAEMERRYKLMSKLGVRNLAGYNTRIDDAASREEFIPNPFSLTPDEPEPLRRLPHIVVVIDELADLMMVVGKKIEELIARLAQKARAAGIHLILATQRPSVDVITGLIKANIPTRIAFQVSSKIDSRTILDQMGAESLLGMGDMLYMASGTGLPVRVHGAFVSDEEVHRVVQYLKSQGAPDYIEGVLEGGVVDGEGGPGEGGESGGEKDPMYDQAVEVVLKHRKASISLVQRHLKIGYNRAARLVEDMENAGLVSAMNSQGQRDILVPARD